VFNQVAEMGEVFVAFRPGLKLVPNVFAPGFWEPAGNNTDCSIKILALVVFAEFPNNRRL
jgi:hypothetical protein